MKKAQLQQAFFYIFAIVIIGALVLIGYKAITKITVAGCEAGKETFKSGLLSLVEQYDARGSQHIEKLSAPCSFNKLCFLDSDAILNSAPTSTTQLPKIIEDAQASQTHTNMWINHGTSWEAIGWSEKVEIGVDPSTSIDPNWICITSRGSTFNVQFNGLGRRTRVGLPTP
ncbi:MAG: hypothetical protein AABX70_06120 [Nanoarchaeota archaeon]